MNRGRAIQNSLFGKVDALSDVFDCGFSQKIPKDKYRRCLVFKPLGL